MNTFLNVLLMTSGGIFSAILLYVALETPSNISGALGFFAFLILPAMGAFACFAGMVLSVKWKSAVALNLGVAVLAAMAADLYFANYARRVTAAARPELQATNISDRKRRLDVVVDLRRFGLAAYPLFSPAEIWRRHSVPTTAPDQRLSAFVVNGREVIPLAGPSNATVAACNELGTDLVFETDEMGFNNPRNQWNRKPVDIVVIGDAYVTGFCVRPEANLVSHIGRRYPNTINVGVPGAGPLTELAILREYVAGLRPTTVLWVYFENDLEDLEQEKRFAMMRRYLEPQFSQNIMGRRKDFDYVLRAYLDDRIRRHTGGKDNIGADATQSNRFDSLFDTVTLEHLRDIVHRIQVKQAADFELFRDVMATARDEVAGWDGQLWFVFLPSWVNFYERAATFDIWRGRNRERVLKIVRDLGIPVIDILPPFSNEKDTNRLFLGFGLHYTPQGYQVAAKVIVNAIGRHQVE